MKIGRFAWITRTTVALSTVVLMAGCGSKPPVEADVTEPPPVVTNDVPPVREEKPAWVDPNETYKHILVNVQFDFNKYNIKQSEKPKLEAIATMLKDNTDFKLLIEGHCDERGTNEYNMGLGEQRALSTKNYLTSLGVSGNRFTTISYGEERPLALGQDEASWAKNRRCQFRVEAPRS